MLTLFAGQAESLWEEALPIGVRELPEDLAGWIACSWRRSWSVGGARWSRRGGRY
jgi:hypothetical protein